MTYFSKFSGEENGKRKVSDKIESRSPQSRLHRELQPRKLLTYSETIETCSRLKFYQPSRTWSKNWG